MERVREVVNFIGLHCTFVMLITCGLVLQLLHFFDTDTVTVKLKSGCKPCRTGEFKILYSQMIKKDKIMKEVRKSVIELYLNSGSLTHERLIS